MLQTQLSKSKILTPDGVDLLDQEADSVTEELALTLNENLTKKSIPYLSSQEQFHLADLVECVAVAEKHRRSMDENATRFLLFFRRYMLRKSQRIRNVVKGLTWREISWAFHSGSQDILVDLVSRHYQGKMQWEHARESGMFMWMTDINGLVSISINDLVLRLMYGYRDLNSKSLLETSTPNPTRKIPLTAVFTTWH